MSKHNIVIKMSRKEALKMGLLECKHCGWPPNNHFDFKPQHCAHDAACPGYREVSTVGKLVTRRLSDRKSKSKGASNG